MTRPMLLRASLLLALVLLSLASFAQIRSPRERNARRQPSGQEERRSDKDDLRAPSRFQRLTLGTYFTAGYANGWIVGATPSVGYEVIDNFLIVGAGVDYLYQDFRPGDGSRDIWNIFGPRGYVQGHLYRGIYAHAEYQYLNYSLRFRSANGNVSDPLRFSEQAVFLGGGFASPKFGDGFWGTFEILIDAIYDEQNSPRRSPLVYRAGIFYSF